MSIREPLKGGREESLRNELVSRGVLRPGRRDGLTPLRLPPGTEVYRIDPRTRQRAERDGLRVSLADMLEAKRGDGRS